jgi:hypothetical protein
MDDPNTRTRKLVTTFINTVNQCSGADIDVVLELLKEYKVRVTGSRWLLRMLTTCDPPDPSGDLTRVLGTRLLFLQSRMRHNVVRAPERRSWLRPIMRLRALQHSMGLTCTTLS